MIARSSDTAACHRTVYESDLSVKELDGDILHLKTGKKQNQMKEKRAEEMPEEMMPQGQKKKKRTKRGGKIQRLVSQGATIGELTIGSCKVVTTLQNFVWGANRCFFPTAPDRSNLCEVGILFHRSIRLGSLYRLV
ncbi:hypothetical protein AYX13_07001 [Cryptococcus neoformans]|nr:hypothetical protein AYX13_07001 [Cryptococcus neoformans var. grubii]